MPRYYDLTFVMNSENEFTCIANKNITEEQYKNSVEATRGIYKHEVRDLQLKKEQIEDGKNEEVREVEKVDVTNFDELD